MKSPEYPAAIRVIDSHTEGEPTRVVLEGWPAPAGATMPERRDDLRRRAEHLRQAVVCEPRGHQAVVGALLTPAVTPGAAAGVIFFNNVGYLGMCGHGTIGVVRTLAHLGRLPAGAVTLDTPVGPVRAALEADGAVTVENVPAFCHARDVALDVPGVGRVTGDVAYGGNWFFLTETPEPALDLAHVDELMRVTKAIQAAIRAGGVAGAKGGEIDHIELSGPPARTDAHGRNFVLCPGGEYDRSPCGTGTSAKMAALHARGALPLEKEWRQESVTGSLFTGWLRQGPAGLVPHIRGRAFITGETTLHFDPRDPFRGGIAAE